MSGIDPRESGVDLRITGLQFVQRPLKELRHVVEAFCQKTSISLRHSAERSKRAKVRPFRALRVVRPGGRAIFVIANPFPILFPYRSLRRILAMTPVVKAMLNRLRTKPPLPYLPMPLGWMKRQLSKWGHVRITGYAVSSVTSLNAAA